MSSLISVCKKGGVYLSQGRDNPADALCDSTTPQQFESSRRKNPNYQLFHLNSKGSTALHLAAKTGNTLMIKYIAEKGEKNLLNLGDNDLRSPLFCTIQFNQRTAAKLLINFCADVNMQCIDYELETNTNLKLIHKNTTLMTPLSYAIEGHTYFPFQGSLSCTDIRNQKIAMAKLLLIHKGIAEPKPKTPQGQAILIEAQKIVDAINATLVIKIANSTPMDMQTITTIIGYVPFDEIPENIPEIPRRDYTTSVNI